MNTYNLLAEKMLLLAHNPAAMQSLLLNQLQSVENDGGLLLRTPTDPVVYIAEMGVMLAHTTLQGFRETVPKEFPSMAATYEDIYRHMSDRDNIGVFSDPAKTELIWFIDTDSLISRAMPLQYAGVRKVIIPRDTVFQVAGYKFAIQYPIEIRVLPYGTPDNPAFQVLWLTEEQSPISPVSTNALEWQITSNGATTSSLLAIRLPVMQYEVTPHSDTITGKTTFNMNRTFNNRFYYVRVWMKRLSSDKWVEIKHTHSRDVYDQEEPTALISVNKNNISCTIPSVYMANGKVSGEIRMDIYTTYGKLDLDISGYPSDEYTFALRDLNGEVDLNYTNPIKSFSIKALAAESGRRVMGGSNGLTFEQLRKRVIDNAVGMRQLPISEKQLDAAIVDSGLTLSKPIDYVTGRTYFMSADMPESAVRSVSTPIGSVTAPWYFTWEELALLPTVKVNGNRLTVLPDTIYKYGGTSISIDAEMTRAYKTMRREDLINAANANRYLFTPFYYVVDINNKAIDVRIYQLDNPLLKSKRFISTNVSTELSVVTADYQLEKTDAGYIVRCITRSEPPYQQLDDSQVFAQISYVPRGTDGKVAYINGTLVGKKGSERVWEFLLETNLDVDRNNELVINNARVTTERPIDVAVGLLTDFNVFYGCTGYYPKNYERAAMDDIIVPPARDGIGITHEIFQIELGKALDFYWRKARPITDSINYKFHQTDVYDIWENDLLAYDENGVPQYTYDASATPPVKFTYVHRKGDKKLDAAGNPIIKYAKGSPVFDANGEPVIDKPRSIKFSCEMAIYDARYKFANTREVTSYLQSAIDMIIGYVTVIIPAIKPQLLENTDAFFVPVTTMGNIDVRTEDGVVMPMPAENQFTVNYYLTAANRENTALLENIRKTTAKTINDYLNTNRTVATTPIGKVLGEQLTQSIIGVEMDNIGPEKDMRMFTVISESARATIGKKLDVEANGEIGIKDDIVISYNRHDTRPE